MRKNLFLMSVIVLSAVALVGCGNGSNTNSTANTNANTEPGMTSRGVPTATATPKYTAEQAREEREKAKANKETIGESLDDAWIHTKIVAKLLGDTKTPERKINVDVVKGEVTLRGTVDTADAKAEAERDAKATDGVTKVTNELKVAPAKAANTNASKSANANKPPTVKGKTP